MMELVPEKINNAVVLNVANMCPVNRSDCRDCSEIGVAVHNWLMQTEFQYVIIDLQDEKEVCPAFLLELLQLRKRLHIPFLFAGVMEKPLKLLQEYNYTAGEHPVFITPEDAIDYLAESYPKALEDLDLTRVTFGEPLQVSRSRAATRIGGESGEDEDTDSDVDD